MQDSIQDIPDPVPEIHEMKPVCIGSPWFPANLDKYNEQVMYENSKKHSFRQTRMKIAQNTRYQIPVSQIHDYIWSVLAIIGSHYFYG